MAGDNNAKKCQLPYEPAHSLIPTLKVLLLIFPISEIRWAEIGGATFLEMDSPSRDICVSFTVPSQTDLYFSKSTDFCRLKGDHFA